MPPQNPYSSFADPNSFLGQPFLPRVVNTLSRGAGNIARAEDQLRSDVISGAQRGLSNLGRLASTVGNALTFPIRAAQQAVSGVPLIGGMAQGRGQRQAAPTPTVPNLPSGTINAYPTMPQRVVSENPRVATAEDIAAFRAANFTRPSQPVAVAPQQPPIPSVAPQRTGVQTPYGMVYPTRGQEEAAQRLAQMPRMGARLEATRETLVNPKSVQSAISSIEAGRGPASLSGLTQAEKIEVMRSRGRRAARDIVQRNESYFASQRGRGIRPIQVEPTQDRVAQRGQGARTPLEGADAEQLPRRQRRQRPFEQGVA